MPNRRRLTKRGEPSAIPSPLPHETSAAFKKALVKNGVEFTNGKRPGVRLA